MPNHVGVLDPMPSTGMIGYTLDLEQPQLALLMDRYVPSRPRAQAELAAPPSAVIVTRRSGQESAVKAELESQGWSVKVCEGPGRLLCPIMRAEPSPLREYVDAAVVFVEPKEPTAGSLPRLRCAADRASPGVEPRRSSRPHRIQR